MTEADNYTRFFEILMISRGLITGSVALAVLLPNGAQPWAPHNLNVVLPRGSTHDMASFLEQIGYRQVHSFWAHGKAFK